MQHSQRRLQILRMVPQYLPLPPRRLLTLQNQTPRPRVP